MIEANMAYYNYYEYGEPNEYGEPTLSEEPQGTVKMAIYETGQSVQENVNYTNANYVGFTWADVSNDMVIEYGNERLKVLYVIKPKRMLNQVMLAKV